MRNLSLLVFVACPALNLNAVAAVRDMEQIPGAITSWAGQPGTRDHSESRSLSEGTVLACEADNAPGGTLPPGCYVSLENGGHYTLRPHYVIRMAKGGVVTLTCNGPSPSWCRVLVTEDKSPLKPSDSKAHKQNDELTEK
jgi:hypothetical protein